MAHQSLHNFNTPLVPFEIMVLTINNIIIKPENTSHFLAELYKCVD